jgi:hypothetical protein
MLGAVVSAQRNVLASGKVDMIRGGEEVPGRFLMREMRPDLGYDGPQAKLQHANAGRENQSGCAKVISDGGGAAFAAQKGTRHRRPSTLCPGAGAAGGLVVGTFEGRSGRLPTDE